MKKKIILALSVLGKDFRVEKTKGLPIIRVYFKGFLTGCFLDLLLSINGLHIVGVNCQDSYVLISY